MATLTNQTFTYTVGTGRDKWTYQVVIKTAGDIYLNVIVSPLGPIASPIQVPQSIVDAFVDSVEALQGGDSSSSTTGSTGSTGVSGTTGATGTTS